MLPHCGLSFRLWCPYVLFLFFSISHCCKSLSLWYLFDRLGISPICVFFLNIFIKRKIFITWIFYRWRNIFKNWIFYQHSPVRALIHINHHRFMIVNEAKEVFHNTGFSGCNGVKGLWCQSTNDCDQFHKSDFQVLCLELIDEEWQLVLLAMWQIGRVVHVFRAFVFDFFGVKKVDKVCLFRQNARSFRENESTRRGGLVTWAWGKRVTGHHRRRHCRCRRSRTWDCRWCGGRRCSRHNTKWAQWSRFWNEPSANPLHSRAGGCKFCVRLTGTRRRHIVRGVRFRRGFRHDSQGTIAERKELFVCWWCVREEVALRLILRDS